VAVRICLIGAGRVAKVHANSLKSHVPSSELVAVVDVNEAVLQETAHQFDIAGRFTSLNDALDGAKFEAVVITTPTFTHKDLSVRAAEAGKHVFIEKPMAMNVEECDAIIQAAEANDVIMQIGFMRRFQPEFVMAAERIKAGEIGQPMTIKSLTNGPGLPPPWANDLKTSNGMLAEVNSHDLDCVRWLMGSNPHRIYVEVANFKGEARGVTAENFYDNVIASIKFESGGLGSISGTCPCDYGYDARVEIIGEKGIMQIGELKRQPLTVVIDREQGIVSPSWRRWPERFEWGYIKEMNHFVESIANEQQPIVGGEDGRWAVAGVLAGTRSFLEERPVYLDEVMGS
jgi:scyllo-inositol 2-dehydrogenase (NAD+)